MTSKRKGYEEKRNHIIQAANTLFLEKGYEATSVDDVLELAKISKGTFYHYFSHKMELLESIVNPNETAALIVQLITYMQERFVEELVKIEPNMQTMNNIVRICQQCIERLLAIPEGSLIIFPAGYIGDYMDSQ